MFVGLVRDWFLLIGLWHKTFPNTNTLYTKKKNYTLPFGNWLPVTNQDQSQSTSENSLGILIHTLGGEGIHCGWSVARTRSWVGSVEGTASNRHQLQRQQGAWDGKSSGVSRWLC